MWSLGTEISWPSKKPREHKQPRTPISLRDGSKETVQSRSHGKYPRAEVQHSNPETTKAVAWAVFQHHGGGGGGGHGYSHGSVAVRRPTRFKIEAQMKQECAHRSLMSDAVAVRWDAGSTLFDSFELDSLLKTLDHAAGISHTDGDNGAEEPGAVVVYSPKQQGITRREQNDLRKHGHGEDGADDEDDSSNRFGNGHTPKRLHRRHLYHKPAKEASHHHHKVWKNLLHSLHLDGANGLFHGLQKFQSQVAPHDSDKKPEPHKGRSHKHNHKDGGGYEQSKHIDVAQFDAHFDRNDLHVSKNVYPPSEKDDYHHRHQLWKLGFKVVLTQPFHGHKESGMEQPRKGLEKYHEQAELRSAWAAFTANLHHQGRQRDEYLEARELQSGVSHHHQYYQHHHHHNDEGEDFEMTVQAISRRVARSSFETRRVSMELDGGLEAPRNSLDADWRACRGVTEGSVNSKQ